MGTQRRWIVTGARGQLGSCLVARLRARGQDEVFAFDRATLDITDASALRNALLEIAPDFVANAAAMTHVDRCENEPEAAEAANAIAPRVVAEACREIGARLVHVSTDYVFDGTGSTPYRESDPVRPQSAYGRTKLAGEEGVRTLLPEALIVRTAWVFGPGRNFVRTMLEAAARSLQGAAPELRVVDDQQGSPTYADDLAQALLTLVEAEATGTYHVANAGVATWWDLARASIDAWGHPELPIERVRTKDFPRPAPRPAWSVLDIGRAERAGVQMRPWREALEAYLHSDASPLRELGASS